MLTYVPNVNHVCPNNDINRWVCSFDFSTNSLQIYIKKFSVTASSKRKTPPLLQVIQRLETNSKTSFAISKSWTLNLFCDLYKQNKLLMQLLKQIFIMLQHNDFLYNGIIRANYKSL